MKSGIILCATFGFFTLKFKPLPVEGKLIFVQGGRFSNCSLNRLHNAIQLITHKNVTPHFRMTGAVRFRSFVRFTASTMWSFQVLIDEQFRPIFQCHWTSPFPDFSLICPIIPSLLLALISVRSCSRSSNSSVALDFLRESSSFASKVLSRSSKLVFHAGPFFVFIN